MGKSNPDYLKNLARTLIGQRRGKGGVTVEVFRDMSDETLGRIVGYAQEWQFPKGYCATGRELMIQIARNVISRVILVELE